MTAVGKDAIIEMSRTADLDLSKICQRSVKDQVMPLMKDMHPLVLIAVEFYFLMWSFRRRAKSKYSEDVLRLKAVS